MRSSSEASLLLGRYSGQPKQPQDSEQFCCRGEFHVAMIVITAAAAVPLKAADRTSLDSQRSPETRNNSLWSNKKTPMEV
jgi:hypothetical protein